MNMIFKTILSMSVSGSLIILVMLGGRLFLKNICSRQWQYYIWLVVILRLVLPFGPQESLMGKFHQTLGQTIAQNVPTAPQERQRQDTEHFAEAAEGSAQEIQGTEWEEKTFCGTQLQEPLPDTKEGTADGLSVLMNGMGMCWLVIALGMLSRKALAYRGFLKDVAVLAKPVSDSRLFEELFAVQKQTGVNRRVELLENPMLSSPTLTGIFHPCIVLPDAKVSTKDFHYIALHELTHCRRWDILYKWLVQAVVCLHWFNPLVYRMSREIANDCEFSCDEAVVAKMGYENAQEYGKTLLDAMAAVGKYRESSAAVTLSADKVLLKERLGAIMGCGEKSVLVRIFTVVLTVCIALGVFLAGVYPTEVTEVVKASEPVISTADPKSSSEKSMEDTGNRESDEVVTIEKAYRTDSLPMFQLAFCRLDEEERILWLDRVYRDKEAAFFSAALDQLNADSPLIQRFAKRAYADGSVSFFSILADHMEETALREWLDLAMTDQKAGFQSMLFDKLEMGEEKDAWEKELDEKQSEEYRAVGVTMEGKNYYYQGQLVNIFLDLRPNKSFYTLNVNPAGSVNIKILRGEDGKITGTAYLTKEEFGELFGGLEEERAMEFPRTMYVDSLVCKIRAGAGVEFPVVGLIAEEEAVTVLEEVEGSGDVSWYRLDKESLTAASLDEDADACFIRSDLLREK